MHRTGFLFGIIETGTGAAKQNMEAKPLRTEVNDLIRMGHAASLDGKFDLAIEYYNKAIGLDPNSAKAYAKRGGVYWCKRQDARAIADCNKAIQLDPKLSFGYYNRGVVYSSNNQHDKSIADASEAIRLDPTNPDSYLLRGMGYHNKKRYDEALSDFTHAIRLDPNYAKAYTWRACNYIQQDKYNEVIEDCDIAIRLDPAMAEAYCWRGYAYDNRNENHKAIADYTEAIRLEPNFFVPWKARSFVYDRIGNHRQAVLDAAEGLRLKKLGVTYGKKRAMSKHTDQFEEIREHEEPTKRLTRTQQSEEISPQPEAKDESQSAETKANNASIELDEIDPSFVEAKKASDTAREAIQKYGDEKDNRYKHATLREKLDLQQKALAFECAGTFVAAVELWWQRGERVSDANAIVASYAVQHRPEETVSELMAIISADCGGNLLVQNQKTKKWIRLQDLIVKFCVTTLQNAKGSVGFAVDSLN